MIDEREHLAHYGIRGMRWGDRRFQNEDGSLTPEGMRRYGVGSGKDARRLTKEYNRVDKAGSIAQYKLNKTLEKANNTGKPSTDVGKYSRIIWQANKYKEGLNKQLADKKYDFEYKEKHFQGDIQKGKTVALNILTNLISIPFGMVGVGSVRDNVPYTTRKITEKKVIENNNPKVKPTVTKDDIKDFETRVTNAIGDLKNDKTYDKYVTIAGIMDSDNDATPRNILGTVAWHRHDDGEQNDHSATAVYAREKGLSDEFEKLSDENWQLSDRDMDLYYGGYGEDDNFNRDKISLFEKNTDPDFDKKINFAKDVMAKLPNLEDAYIRKFNPGSEEYWDIPWSKLEPWQIAEINKQLGILKHSDISSDYLAHYGIKGQEWGKRRFQNEDGSLTPEGRRRYGLKSDYSNMTDQQLRDAITTKRTQNQYVDIMTKDARKKRQDISNFVRTASSTAGSVVNLADKTILEKQRSDFDERIEKYKNHNKALAQQKIDVKKDNPKADFSKVDATIKENNEKIDFYKDAKKNIGVTKDLTSQAVSFPGTVADPIGKLATSSELEEQTQLAYRNIQEMDKDDLKKVVDRMMLEKQYDELINPPQPSKWERGREIVQSIGVGIGILTGIASLALTIKKLSAKQSDLDDGSEFLAHYGVKGMRKGVRRWTNEDGTLTPEGYRHYGIDPRGRQTSPQDILARQRAREKAQKMELRSQIRQNAYTQKIAQRQALREAKSQARIQNVYDRQNLAIQKQAKEQELKAKAENRENIRKNVVKGAVAIAAIAGAVMIGRHILKERSLNAMHVRDMERETLLGKQRMDELKESNRLGILKEENRMKEIKLNERVATPDIKTPNPSKVNNPINNGTGMFKGQANERRESREQKDFEKGLKDALNYQEQGRQANERESERRIAQLKKENAKESKRLQNETKQLERDNKRYFQREAREQKDFEKGLKDTLNYQEQGRQANERQRLDNERRIQRESREWRIADRANALSERRERQAQESLLRTQRQSETRAHNERQRELERVFKNDAKEQKAKKNLIKGFSTDWASSETKVRDIPNNTSNSVKPFVENITREKRYDSTKLNRMYAAQGTNAAKKVFEKLVYRTSGRIRHEEEECYVTS